MQISLLPSVNLSVKGVAYGNKHKVFNENLVSHMNAKQLR